MTMPLVSIIILTYGNGWAHVRKCFDSLQKLHYPNFEVILVDNGSENIQNSKLIIKNYNFKIKILTNKVNVGFCGGNNQGFKRAVGKYILFLNNDTQVTKNFLTKLVAVLEMDEKIGVVQPKIRQLTEKDKLDACASFLTPTGFLYHYGYSQRHILKKYNKSLAAMYSVKGACFLTRKTLVNMIGLFDDDYFAYFEETDFCHRVWLAGYTVRYVPDSQIFHLGGVGKNVSSTIQFHSYKNRIQTYIKNFEIKTLMRILPMHILFCISIAGVYVINRKFSYAFAIIKALIWNVVHFNLVLQKRRFVQHQVRVLADSEFSDTIEKKAPLSYYKHLLFDPRGYFNFEKI